MAFNLGINDDNKRNNESLRNAEKHVSLAISLYEESKEDVEVEFDNTKDAGGKPKVKYYLEWWRIGDEKNAVQNGTFHTNNIKHFVKTFIGLNKYTIVYLERVADGRVLKDARSTLR